MIMTKSLTELANQYGTDKGTVGPVRTWSAHNYTDIYEAYLERYRLSTLTILEIGLGVTGDRWKARDAISAVFTGDTVLAIATRAMNRSVFDGDLFGFIARNRRVCQGAGADRS